MIQYKLLKGFENKFRKTYINSFHFDINMALDSWNVDNRWQKGNYDKQSVIVGEDTI